VTATQLRELVKGVVESHATHNTFYSIWSDVKDRETELTYPCAIWDQWRARLTEDEFGQLHRAILVRLLIVTAVATDRQPIARDTAVEAADNAAADYVLKIRQDYPDLVITNVSTTTQFDEYTQLETGVLLTMTVEGEGLCLDSDHFEPGIPGECVPGAVRNSDDTYTASVASGGTLTLPDVTHTDSDGTPAVRPAMVPFVATLCAPCLPGRVMSSDEEDAVPVVTVPPGADVPLPRFIFAWTNKEEEVQTEINPLGFNGTFLTTFPDPMPRFEVRRASDNGIIATGDIANPFVELSPQEVRNSADAVVSYHEVDDPGVAPDATIQLKDSSGTNIGSPVGVPSGTSANITAPDGTVTVRNLNGTALGSPSVKSNGTANYTAPIPMKMGWGAGDADTLEWTVTDAEAGTYNSYTQDGGSGTITYSKNGGSYTALSGTITLAVGNTIKVRRTTTTNAGYSTWAP